DAKIGNITAAQRAPVHLLNTAENRLSHSVSRDVAIETSLTANLAELGRHSFTTYEYAYKHATRKARRCVFCPFKNYPESLNHVTRAVVRYKSLDGARQTAYEPVIRFIEKYSLDTMFVALVAIKTGDKRDSLMKCMLLGRDAQRNPEMVASGLNSANNEGLL